MWLFRSRVSVAKLREVPSGRREPAEALKLGDLARDEIAWEANKLLKADRPAEALALFDLLAALWPRSSPDIVHLGRGVCRQKLGKLVEADESYTAAIELDPAASAPHAWINRGETRILLGRFDDATTDLAQARRSLTETAESRELLLRLNELERILEIRRKKFARIDSSNGESKNQE
jgi:tetratricopeptide (TPR) repeat protein